MPLFGWTAAFAIYICGALLVLILAGCLASLATTGRTRVVIQVVLALIGLAIALLLRS